MVLTEIESMIADAIADEARTSRAGALIGEVAERNGKALSDVDRVQGVRFAEEYVRTVPRALQEGLDRARGTHAADKMDRMLAVATAYWVAADDVIPDHLGLVGILDDAYATLALIEALSRRFEAETGTPLVSLELTAPNEAMRALLGDEVVARLDDFVEDALADTSLQELLASLMDEPMPPPPPAGSHWPDDDLGFLLFGDG